MNRYFLLAWRYLSGRKLRTALTTLAITLGVMILFGMSSLVPSMAQAFRNQMLTIAGEVDITLAHASGGVFSPQVADTVRDDPQVERAAGVLSQNILLAETRPNAPNIVTLVGTETAAERQVRAVEIVSGRALQPDDIRAALISQTLADAFELQVGDAWSLPSANGVTELVVTGIFRAAPSPGNEEVIVPLATAQQMLNLPGLINSVEVIVRSSADRGQVQQQLLARLESGYTTSLPQFGEEFMSGMRLGEQVFNTFGFLALLMGGFIIFNTFRTVVAERRHDLGMLRAIGATRKTIFNLILIESLLQGLLGTLLGLAAGAATAYGMVALVNPTMRDYMRFEISAPVFSSQALVLSVALGIGITVLGGLLPAIGATRLSPLDALRPSLPPVNRWQSRLRTVLGLALMAASLVGLFSGEVGLSALGMLLFISGLVLISPALVQPLASLLSRMLAFLLAREGQLAQGNVARQPGRSAITASTVMISLAIIVAAGGMITSVNHGLTQYIQRSLGADFLIMPPAMVLGSGNLGASPQLAADVAAAPEIEAVSSLRIGKTAVNGEALQLIGIDPLVFPRVSGLIFSAGDEQTAYAELGQSRAVIVNGIYALQAGVKTGDTLSLLTPNGEQTYRVAGIGVDFLNAKLATAYISQANLERDFNIASDVLLMANAKPGADLDAARQSLQSLLAAYPNFSLTDAASFRADTLKGSQAGFLLMYFLILALALPSLLGMINTLAINVIERTREIGLLRAIGSTRRQVRRMIRAESLLLASIGTAFGLISGVWLGKVLIDALTVGGFPMPYSFPYAGILLGIAGGILLGVLAASLPARQAVKMEIIRALRYE
ncbi:MAG: FtsX-like permease family protein [Bellilinea sp.]|jgi:putative ABC transport system permease protein